MEELNLPTYFFKIKEEHGKKYIFDEIRRRYVALTPEEWVRQHIAKFLVEEKKYPRQLIAVEKKFKNNTLSRRYDLLIFNRFGLPLMLVECKSPTVEIKQNVFDQISRYNQNHKAKFLLITNGLKHYCCKVNIKLKNFKFLKDIPEYETMIAGEDEYR